MVKGSVAFWVKHDHADWATNSKDYEFNGPPNPDFNAQAIKHGDGAIEVILDGPTIPCYRRRVPMPPPSKDGVHVAVTWDLPKWTLYLNGQPVPDDPPKQMEQQTIKLVASPSHGPEVAMGITFSLSSPWSDNSVTVLAAPNIVDFTENADVAGANVRQVQVLQHTADTHKLSLDLQAHADETVLIQGNKVNVRLLTVYKVREDNQDFLGYDLLITSNEG